MPIYSSECCFEFSAKDYFFVVKLSKITLAAMSLIFTSAVSFYVIFKVGDFSLSTECLLLLNFRANRLGITFLVESKS